MTIALWLAAVIGLGGCRGGCSRASGPAPRPSDALSWFPAETQVIVAIDFAKLRATPLGAGLEPVMKANPDDQAQIDEFVRRTGFDPLHHVESLWVAFPEEARHGGAMAAVLRGRGLDEARLVSYVKDQVQKQGDELISFRRAGRTLWTTRKQPTVAGFFPDAETFVLGAGGWAEKMAELSHAGTDAGATTNLPLVHLVERVGVHNPIWAAAIVPAATRAQLAADPRLASGSGINAMALAAKARNSLEVKLIADFATREQAQSMVAEVAGAIRDGKKSPAVLLMGIGPLLDGIDVHADGVSCEIAVRLSEPQVADGVERLKALLTLGRRDAVPGFPHP